MLPRLIVGNSATLNTARWSQPWQRTPSSAPVDQTECERIAHGRGYRLLVTGPALGRKMARAINPRCMAVA